ncbi:alpha/beta fold hydrolase [Corynebacterium fournieri]|uniref:alpha/beta fold hydrolase n=1 Tax=Corynebacterium fournieri TaxID=1852390 RepID=UPI000A2F4332|nr:alpha/beta fold hydrolase [Corynebacterium fournieri]WJY98140.1 3-oxoadipate enol-lactonase 2 [Corynebacterium fournieri]
MTFLRTQEFGTPDGEAVVLLSSIATTSEAWSEVVPALSRYRVITVDHRGHGGSGVPAQRPEDVATLGGDVLAALDELGVDHFSVVGVSLGGAIAQWLAANSPRVDKAVFAATATYLGGKQAWEQKIATALHDGTSGLTPTLLGNWFTEGFRTAHPDAVQRVADMIDSVDDEGYAHNGTALATWDFGSQLRKITCPVLTIAGASDPTCPPEKLAAIAAGVSGPVRSIVVAPAAHQVAIENPDAFNAALTQFLES